MTETLATDAVRLLNIEQVQARLGVGRSTVFDLIKVGTLRSVVIGRRRLVPEQAVIDFINQLDRDAR